MTEQDDLKTTLATTESERDESKQLLAELNSESVAESQSTDGIAADFFDDLAASLNGRRH